MFILNFSHRTIACPENHEKKPQHTLLVDTSTSLTCGIQGLNKVPVCLGMKKGAHLKICDINGTDTN